LVDAAIHGDERVSSEALYYTLLWLLKASDSDASKILADNLLLVIPLVNLDKYGLGRTNVNIVDLNRNFATGWELYPEKLYNGATAGEYPLSEPECQAVHNVLVKYKPEWYLNLHCGAYYVVPPWGYKSGVPEQAYYRSVYSKIVVESRERKVTAIPYSEGNGIGGSARDEGYINGAYTFLVELSYSYSPRISTVKGTVTKRLTSVLVVVCVEAAKDGGN